MPWVRLPTVRRALPSPHSSSGRNGFQARADTKDRRRSPDTCRQRRVATPAFHHRLPQPGARTTGQRPEHRPSSRAILQAVLPARCWEGWVRGAAVQASARAPLWLAALLVCPHGVVELQGVFLVPQGPAFTSSWKASPPAGRSSGHHTAGPQRVWRSTHSGPHARAGVCVLCSVCSASQAPPTSALGVFPSRGLSRMPGWSHGQTGVPEAGSVLSPVSEPAWV